MPKQIVLALIFLLMVACTARAQEGLEQLSPFATGAGRTFAVTPRGLDAVGLNPSLLGLGTPRPFELSIIPFSSFGVNAGPSFTQINSISKGFQNGNLASQDSTVNPELTKGDSIRVSFANLLNSNKLSSTADARLFGLSYYDPNIGAFALTLTTHAALRVSLPDTLLGYIGLGFLSRFSEGDKLPPQQVDVQGLWYSEYTLSFARNIMGDAMSGQPQLLAGVGLKYVEGIAMIRMTSGSTFSINYPFQPQGSAIANVNYQIDYAYPSEFDPNHLPNGFSTNLLANASAGSGLGADIGFTLGAFDSLQNSPWQLGLSITDIGYITWTKNTDVRSADTLVKITTSTVGDKDTINGELAALGGKLNTTDAPITTALPTTLHIAGALDLSQIGITIASARIGVAAEYALGLTSTVGAPDNGRFGFGATLEVPSSTFAWHTALGFTTQDGVTGLTFAIGCGIGNRVMIDAGTSGLTQLFQSGTASDAIFDIKVLL
jgi:hypothetical protein